MTELDYPIYLRKGENVSLEHNQTPWMTIRAIRLEFQPGPDLAFFQFPNLETINIDLIMETNPIILRNLI